MKEASDKLNSYRKSIGIFQSTDKDGTRGMFFLPTIGKKGPTHIKIISTGPRKKSDEGLYSWEHVSASLQHRCPTWKEMCKIKDLFWSAEETVLQFHPPESEYVNNMPTCLHLWKGPQEIELPPTIALGFKR